MILERQASIEVCNDQARRQISLGLRDPMLKIRNTITWARRNISADFVLNVSGMKALQFHPSWRSYKMLKRSVALCGVHRVFDEIDDGIPEDRGAWPRLLKKFIGLPDLFREAAYDHEGLAVILLIVCCRPEGLAWVPPCFEEDFVETSFSV